MHTLTPEALDPAMLAIIVCGAIEQPIDCAIYDRVVLNREPGTRAAALYRLGERADEEDFDDEDDDSLI
jgi:hypothetical protein